MRLALYDFFWQLANRWRLWCGRPALPRRCCRSPDNLAHFQIRPDLVVKVCRQCGARHFEATLDPGHIGLRGSQIGA